MRVRIVVFQLTEDGLYPFATHGFVDATKGAVGVFTAGIPVGTALR